ncbi:MAG: prephenate dehydratase [Candidatus Omnitrophota bacterium]
MRVKKSRHKIDRIDGKIVDLLNERARETLAIRAVKKKLNKGIFTPRREREVYEGVVSRNRGPLSPESIRAIYREIMSGSLALDKSIIIAYLGPEATFTHIAALKKFGASVDYLECKSIADVFTEVERGRADYGVVPIENSTEGAVNHTLDMFINSDLKICSEAYLRIEHNLLANHKRLSAIKKVCSHQQVFAQCRIWLEKNLPKAKLISFASTTEAAIFAAQGKGRAAIASKLAAEEYELKILARSIEDSPRNITRFLVIGNQNEEPTRKDKTSVVFSMKDRAGALHDVLAAFKRNRINLTKIESRPSRLKAWEYYFFVDMEGHYRDKRINKAISVLGKSCTYLKVLGSYPVGK